MSATFTTASDPDGAIIATTWTLLAQAAGNQPAFWTNNSNGSVAVRYAPQLRVSARAGTAGAARKVRVEYSFPEIATVDGKTEVLGRYNATLEVSCPETMSEGQIAEAYHLLSQTIHNPALGTPLTTGYIS